LPRVFVKTAFKVIRFECQRCGSCCHHKRPQEFGPLVPLERLKEFWEKSNLIYLNKEDIENIGKKTQHDPGDFVDTLFDYDGKCVKVDEMGRKIILDLPVLKSKEDTTCIFYDKGCSIYSVRPKACRLFPFRVEEETTPQGDMILCINHNPTCPGIGKGKNVDRKALEKLVTDQFRARSECVAAEVQCLVAEGKIRKDAAVYRTLPGSKSKPQ
jgi:Fe-S-cluster containining protein